jgi:hypothetical protein
MKSISLLLLVLFFTIASSSQSLRNSVNPILGDQGYIEMIGEAPNAETTEVGRIQTHLLYVEQLLRKNVPANISEAQRSKRGLVLDLLHKYLEAAIFPVNRDYKDERRPCFIDADGKICAVGYLIEKTESRELAEAINEKHQYDYLLEMNEASIQAWADEYGLTLTECAMIQPTYGPPPSDQVSYVDIKPSYGVASALVGGSNLALSIANFSGRWRGNKTVSCLGIIAGTGQVIMGAANIRKSNTSTFNGSNISYEKQNNLSFVNIAAGTTTIISSVLNLAMNKKNKETKNAFNLYGQPNYANSLTMGLSFTKRM